MATATVSYSDYQEGRLPSVCVVSGQPTTDRFTYRTVIPASGGGATGLVGRLEDFIQTVNPGAPRNVLLGRIPVDPEVRAALWRRRITWRAVFVASALALIVAAWAGMSWSPYIALAGTVGMVVASVRRRSADRALPIPELTHGGSWVTLRNVHERFAAAASADAG